MEIVLITKYIWYKENMCFFAKKKKLYNFTIRSDARYLVCVSKLESWSLKSDQEISIILEKNGLDKKLLKVYEL